jgi:hypothetical protein
VSFDLFMFYHYVQSGDLPFASIGQKVWDWDGYRPLS